jgi:hypothetical protein
MRRSISVLRHFDSGEYIPSQADSVAFEKFGYSVRVKATL